MNAVRRRLKRLDHHAMYMWVMGGLVPLTGTMINIGPVPYGGGLTGHTQALLVFSILGGALTCIAGMFTGTKRFLPNADKRLPFALAISGGLGVWLGMLGYIILLAASDPSHWAIILAVNLGLYVSFGTLHGIVDFAREIKHMGDADAHGDC